jgi:hypothetical protein
METLLSKRLDGPLTAERIERAEGQLLQLPQAECPLVHRFAAGVCIREVQMPAGALIIGHAHKFADFNILLAGRLTLLMPDGSMKELSAPLTFVGTPGRKIAYIHETVTWQNVWATTETDIETVEALFLDKSPGWQANRAQRLALDRLARQGDREDFERFLTAAGLPAEDVRRISQMQSDQIPMPAGDWKFQVGDSAIEGKGVLATADLEPDEVIGPARIAGQRTPLGRYTNHAADANAKMEVCVRPSRCDWDIVLVATRPIPGCRGGQPGEEITVNYEQALAANNALAIANAKNKEIPSCQPSL